MNILIYHNYILNSCKYPKTQFFMFKIIDNSGGGGGGGINLNNMFARIIYDHWGNGIYQNCAI